MVEIPTEINGYALDMDSGGLYWIGLADLADEGKFVWQHSFQPLNWTNWCNRLCDSSNCDGNTYPISGKGDCVFAGFGSNFNWMNADCKDSTWNPTWFYNTVCQYDPAF